MWGLALQHRMHRGQRSLIQESPRFPHAFGLGRTAISILHLETGVAGERRGMGWEIYHAMSKTNWAAKVERVLQAWEALEDDELNKALVGLLRAERARARRVVRMAKQQMADSLDASVGPLLDDSWVGYAQACDDILRRLK